MKLENNIMAYCRSSKYKNPHFCAGGDPRKEIDDYNLVNLTLRRQNIAEHWDVAISVRNLFDKDARGPSPYDPSVPYGALIPGDYPLSGREIRAELRFHF